MIDNILKSNDLKITNQRKQILSIINELNDNATIKNIIKNSKDIDKSTIYRIIELLINKNIIDKDININNEIFYYINESHSHYVTCVKCHKKEKIDICPFDKINKDLTKNGYQILTHKIEIMGICKKCQGVV